MNSAFSGLTHDHKMANLFGSQWPGPDGMLSPLNGVSGCSMGSPRSQLNGFDGGLMDSPRSQLNGFSGGSMDSLRSQVNGFSGGSMNSPRRRRQLMNDYYCRGSLAPELVASLSRSPATVDAASLYEHKYGINLPEERGVMSRLPNNNNFRPCTSVQELLQFGLSLPNATRGVPRSNTRMPQGNLDSITSEGSFIIQGEGLNYVVSRGLDHSRCQRAGCESGFAKQLHRSEPDIRHQIVGYENPRSPRNGCSFPLLPKYNSLVEARGSIYLIAKDQHGCRFLQRMFDEGTLEDVQVIFNEIIDHVVELMINPFGNYLMQKLLDVCDEEQRMQIILVVTQEPGQLVRISLNTHGTRVVQKLIETLKTRQQISLVVSALEPGFLSLIKDLNGNHVVQHCLQCLSNEDNKFIFVAAAKYCVDIATHQHGCCVLQRCIGHSSGEYREKLVAEISNNALLLAQDQYGNYVVQFILDLRIPSATSTLSSQFQGKYVHMSMQKFSSHVVEKCLAVFNDEKRSSVIHELLYAPHFEQLLQDPHANYVVQSALRHSEGHVHNLLVEAIESHKAISRNSPYSKKIFSQKLLKK
ncbi:putative pumilio homolog 8, chloroplastic [Cajanus cajan]|uniref:putative pumilio homolog 8, chloroplastic n=1 Tax=Cajanus cajan TaxID=3821 RepID=UPI00098DAD61|nr:putative pumilio homolog 8, chloroplastic [Cajanus cajan]